VLEEDIKTTQKNEITQNKNSIKKLKQTEVEIL